MDSAVVKLRDDLQSRWRRLSSIFSHAQLHIADHFDSLRNTIDLASEQRIADAEKSETEKVEKIAFINSIRQAFIQELAEQEKYLLSRMVSIRSEDEWKRARENCELIGKRIEEFFPADENAKQESDFMEPTDFEDSYEILITEMLKQTYQIEKLIMANHTLIFMEAGENINLNPLGILIHLAGIYLDPIEIESLNALTRDQKNLEYLDFLNKFVEKTKNKTFCIHIREPFVVTKNIMVIWALARTLKSPDKLQKLIFDNHVLKLNATSDADSNMLALFEKSYEKINMQFYRSPIEAFEEDTNPFEFCQLAHGRLTLNKGCKNIGLSSNKCASKLIELNLSQNLIKRFDDNFVKSLINVTDLILVKAFDLDVEFNLDFLPSLSKLTVLYLSLPPSFNFKLLAENTRLGELFLHSAASRDANLPRTVLDQDAFNILSNMSSLEYLLLEGFKMSDVHTIPKFLNLKKLVLQNNLINRIESAHFEGIANGLVQLSLSQNNISHIEDSLFKSFIKLENLQIKSNQIMKLTAQTFLGLKNITMLELSDNKIQELPVGVFDSMQQLQYLYLSKNQIKQIKHGVFRTLKNLQCLFIDKNPIETIESNAFMGLESLAQLNLNECQLESIESGMFKGLSSLSLLSLTNNRIRSFCLKLDEQLLNLNKADLTASEVELIRENMFVDLEKLVDFELHNNQLEEIDLAIFSNLKSLERIDLQFNRLRVISNRFLETLNTSVQEIHLNDNRIETLESGFFRQFAELHSVCLQNNQLTWTIDESTFSPNVSLVQLKLTGNKSIELQSGAWRALEDVIVLSLESEKENSLMLNLKENGLLERLSIQKSTQRHVEAWLSNLEVSLSHLTSLDISFCSIESLDGMSLGKYFSSLTELLLSDNLIKDVKSSWFAGLDSLKHLNLSNNHVTALDDPEVFRDRLKLKAINLSGNKLTRIHRGIFRGLFDLATLDLSNNELKILDDGLFRDQVRLEAIKLNGNKLEHLKFAKVLKRTRILRVIDISNNQLDDHSFDSTVIDELEFRWRLNDLNLAHNRLKSFGFIRNYFNLEKLDVSHNEIESIYDESGRNLLGRLISLTHLDLSHNQIRSVKEDSFNNLIKNLQLFDISHNAFNAE